MTAELEFYRERTEKTHRKMAGVTLPSFRCAKCGKLKLVQGRRRVDPKAPKYGFMCAECAE